MSLLATASVGGYGIVAAWMAPEEDLAQ